MKKPKVSVCIPVYNGEDFIQASIDSVLKQTFSDFELIISDNASTDRTVSLIQKVQDSRIRLLASEINHGPEWNWNRVVSEARGDYIKLLCSDDLLFPNCLEEQVKILEDTKFSQVGLVCSRRSVIDENGNTLIQAWGGVGKGGILSNSIALQKVIRSGTNPIGEPCAVLFRRTILQNTGLFSARIPYMIDLDMWTRMLKNSDLYFDPQPLCAFRVSTNSWSSQIAKKQSSQQREFFNELRKRYHDRISWIDFGCGILMATAKGILRQFFYYFKNTMKNVKLGTDAVSHWK